jgi:hypothetical protein
MIVTMARFAPIVMLAIALLAARQVRAADDDPTRSAPARAAAQFMHVARNGDPDALAAWIDGEALAARAFDPEDLARVPPADRAPMHRDLAMDRAMSLALNASRIGGVVRAEVREGTADTASVDVILKTQTGYEKYPLDLARTPTGWKVVDFGDGDARASTLLRRYYARHRSRQTPAEFAGEWLRKSLDYYADRDRGTKQSAAATQIAADAMRRAAAGAAATATATATAPAAPGPATLPYATASDSVRAYVDLIKQRRVADAIATFWDFDRMIRMIFGDDRADAMSPDERRAAADPLARLVQSVMAIPEVGGGLADATFSDFSSRELTERMSLVNLTMRARFPRVGPVEHASRLYLWRGEQGWKLYDIRASGRAGGMVETFRTTYAKMRHEFTPVQFLARMQHEIEAMKAAAPAAAARPDAPSPPSAPSPPLVPSR